MDTDAGHVKSRATEGGDLRRDAQTFTFILTEEKGGNTVGAFLYASLHSRQQMPFLLAMVDI